MSLIQDYPCPICGANVFKVGIVERLLGGSTDTVIEFNKNEIDFYPQGTSYFEGCELLCNNCIGIISTDNLDDFLTKHFTPYTEV